MKEKKLDKIYDKLIELNSETFPEKLKRFEKESSDIQKKLHQAKEWTIKNLVYSGKSIPKDMKINRHYSEIMTNLVKKDKEFVRYMNLIKKDQNNSKKGKTKEQEDDNKLNNNQIFLPLINLSKELRKKENEKNKQNILIVNEVNGDFDDEDSFENDKNYNNNYYNNTDEATYNPRIKQIKSQLNLNINTDVNLNEKNYHLNTDIEKSILPVVNTNFDNINNKNKKRKKKNLRSSSLYVTDINLIHNSNVKVSNLNTESTHNYIAEVLQTESTEKTPKDHRMKLFALEAEKEKEKQKQIEKERLLFMDFNIKMNQKDPENRKKKAFCDLDKFDMVTNYIENEIVNDPKMKKLPMIKFKKFNSIDFVDEDKVHNKLYKIPSDLLQFLKRK